MAPYFLTPTISLTHKASPISGTEAGRTEYKRIIDRCSELGITHILFAPRNSDISSRQNGTDNW